MSMFKVGETVRWIRAAEWKLKDSIGTITQIIAFDDPVAYKVGFTFGTIILGEKKIEAAKIGPRRLKDNSAFIKVTKPNKTGQAKSANVFSLIVAPDCKHLAGTSKT